MTVQDQHQLYIEALERDAARWRAIISTKVNQTIRGEWAAPMYGLKAESIEQLADAIIQRG